MTVHLLRIETVYVYAFLKITLSKLVALQAMCDILGPAEL